jgi:hypothetical protein
MKTKKIVALTIAAGVLLALAGAVGAALAQGPRLGAAVGTAFTYQGQLSDGGEPADDTYDFQFELHDHLTSDSQVGSTLYAHNKPVTDGLFTVQLDFGSGVFDGEARYLEIGVRAGDSTGSYTTLTPRQELTAAPYALYATAAPWSGLSGVPAGFADGEDDDTTYAGADFALSNQSCPGNDKVHAIDSSGYVSCASDIDTNTTYSPGNQLNLVGNTFNVLEGAGSGLDADLLDGQQGSAFASASHDHWGQTWTGSGTGLTLSGGTTGVHGSGSTYGVRGEGPNLGVSGYSDTGIGVHGQGSICGVYYQGGLAGTGTKSAIVATEDYAWRHLYAVESPELWFEDFGTAQMAGGQAIVGIEPIFAQTVNLSDTYHVFLTPLGDCGLFVSQKSLTSFAVQALGGQACNIAFDYRIIARRLGYEDHRLEPAEDPNQVMEQIQSQQEGP